MIYWANGKCMHCARARVCVCFVVRGTVPGYFSSSVLVHTVPHGRHVSDASISVTSLDIGMAEIDCNSRLKGPSILSASKTPTVFILVWSSIGCSFCTFCFGYSTVYVRRHRTQSRRSQCNALECC